MLYLNVTILLLVRMLSTTHYQMLINLNLLLVRMISTTHYQMLKHLPVDAVTSVHGVIWSWKVIENTQYNTIQIEFVKRHNRSAEALVGWL